MEVDTVMVYQIQKAVEDAVLNLNDIAEEETSLFPMNVKIVKEAEESNNFVMVNSVAVSVSASNVPARKLTKICKSSSRSTNEPQVYVIKENFVLHNARPGKERAKNIKYNLIPSIVSNIESHSKNHTHVKKVGHTLEFRFCIY